MSAVRFVVAGDPDQRTGGYLYDARIAQALRVSGFTVTVHGLEGRFPDADARAAQALAAALAGFDGDDLVVIDGLVLGGLPQVAARYADERRLIALIHHPLADEYGLAADIASRLRASEQAALRHVRRVVTTSAYTARHVVADYGVPASEVNVVEPGVDGVSGGAAQRTLSTPTRASGLTIDVAPEGSAWPPVSSGDPLRLLCVATLVPRKGHGVLVEALSRLRDLAWQCECVGDAERDPACTRALRQAIARHGLGDRVVLRGVLDEAGLARAYAQAQVFVLPSYYEGYGMVITEALVQGLPIVTTTGGALAQTVPEQAGLRVPPGDAAALAAALRRVLDDAALRASLAAGARRAAQSLPGWEAAGARFAAVLRGLDARSPEAQDMRGCLHG